MGRWWQSARAFQVMRAFRPPPEASAYFAAMSVKPDAARKVLIASLVSGLKADGILGKLDTLFLLAAHDEQAGRINLVNPAELLTAVGGPTFTADRGFNGDGAASYLTDGINLSARARFQLNSASMFVWVNGGATSNNALVGNFGGTPGAYIVPARASTSVMRSRLNDSTSADSSAAITSPIGLSVISRSASGSYSQYRDGAAVSAPAIATISVPVEPFDVGRSGGLYNGSRVAATGLGADLTAGEVAQLHARLSVYLAAIGGAA